MKRLLLLILCLLATCKISSQNDTVSNKKAVVILSEDQARSIIKELIHLDALEKINDKLEKRISNFLLKETMYKETLKIKDSIINNKDEIISIKDKIINAKKPLEFHSYFGGKINNLQLANPEFYYQVQFELNKFNLGAQIDFQPKVLNTNINVLNYSFYIEYKVF